MKTKLFLTGLALIAGTYLVNAQNQPVNNRSTGRGYTFVDNNKNGVCDNFENRQSFRQNQQNATYGRRYGSGKGKGINRGQTYYRSQRGPNFVDTNKNGVCDYYENAAPGRSN